MRWGRQRGPVVEPVLYFVRSATSTARAWAESRGVPCWVEELPGGWVLLRSATVDGLLAGSLLPADDALRDWATLTADAYLIDDTALRGVRDGQVHDLDDDLDDVPWAADDHRQVRGLLALRGDRSAELAILATAQDAPVTAVHRDGWTLLPHDDPSGVGAVFASDSQPGLALLRTGDELHLWLVGDDGPIAGWDWSVHGSLAAVDRLPPGEVGDEVRDILYSGRIGVEPFQATGMPATPALAQLLGSPGTAVEIVPDLVRALGLPDATRAHLLDEVDLSAADAVTVQPAGTLAGAIAGSVLDMGRQVASTRTPRRRLWGALGGAVFLPVAAVLLVLFVRDLADGRDVAWWVWLRSVVVLLSVPVAIGAIRSWWVLRGTGQRSEAELPDEVRAVGRETSLGRWFNQRGPATATCLALAAACLGIGIFLWTDEAPLRDRGVETTARITGLDGDTALIEFSDQAGRPVRAALDNSTAQQPGETVSVVFDPADPEHVVLAAELRDPLGYILLGAAAGALLLLAALTWARVIDWQRVSGWLS